MGFWGSVEGRWAKLNSKDPKMSLRSVVVTLSASLVTAVLFATAGYSLVSGAAKWLHQHYVPLDPCVIIAVCAAGIGMIAYHLELYLGSSVPTDPSTMVEDGRDTAQQEPTGNG
ncbi:MAG: hypothetical protein AAGA30_08000 [Planctomycetota bacterium]